MKHYDNRFDEELKEREVMNFFNCDASVARKIIESSKMNGQLDTIKQKCKKEKENRNG